jgi:hypothetical protein
VSPGLSTCRKKHSCRLRVFEKRIMRLFGLKKGVFEKRNVRIFEFKGEIKRS